MRSFISKRLCQNITNAKTLTTPIPLSTESQPVAELLPAEDLGHGRVQQDLETGYSGRSESRRRNSSFTRYDISSGLARPQQTHSTELQLWQPFLHQQLNLDSVSALNLDHDLRAELQERAFYYKNTAFPEPLPKYRCPWFSIIRWEWFSVYRRLYMTVLLINIIIIAILFAEGKLLGIKPGAMSTGLIANVTIAVLFRQEYIVNGLFLIFGCCPQSAPLWIKGLAAKIYHFGGVHSGAGIASVLWLALLDVSLAKQFTTTEKTKQSVVVIIISSVLNFLLLCVVVTSYPKFRAKHHNTWELIHRFGGWISVALFWVNFGLLTDEERKFIQPEKSVFEVLVVSPTFWMLFVVTLCLAMPWLRLRKVEVEAEKQSDFATRLHFNYTNLPLCAAPKFSKSPLREWHSFAGIPHENGIGFSVLISAVGDWTKDVVEHPPRKLWTRGIPVRGVLHIAPVFRRIVLVATGSGIGPVLSLLYAREIPCRILWSTRDPYQTYQPEVLQQVLRADEKAVIISRAKGEADPNLASIAHQLYQESGAEAVFVISNKDGCYTTRTWLESRGILCFTPIFDS